MKPSKTNIKFIILFLSIFFINFQISVSQTAVAPSEGAGTSENPYRIKSIENLHWIALSVNRLGLHYLQTNDIDASETINWFDGQGWLPIGTRSNKFHGFYNGQGFKVFGLHIDRPDRHETGLFGCIGHMTSNSEATTIRNLGVTDFYVAGAHATGSLVGRVDGNANTLIERCFAYNGIVIGDGPTGGLVGANNSWRETAGGVDNPTVSESYAIVDVYFSGKESANKYKFGGLVGCNQKGNTINSYAMGDVTVNGCERVGGLAGCTEIRGLIENSYSIGRVDAPNSTLVGGLLGNADGTGLGNKGETRASFWDVETSNQATSSGSAIPKNTEQMNQRNTFTNVGWDFENIWKIDDNKSERMEIENVKSRKNLNDGYPYFQWQEFSDPLPITLLSFKGLCNSDFIQLDWITASEVNNDFFTIQRSEDAINWTDLGNIQGAGFSSTFKKYSFNDYTADVNKINYYRIKQTDFDTETTYSRVIAINCQNKGSVATTSIFPNPSNTGLFFIESNNLGNIYSISDANGKTVAEGKILNKIETVDLQSQAPGIYFMKIGTQSNNKTYKLLYNKQ